MSVSPTIGKFLRDDGSSSSATTPRVALALVVVVSSDGLVSYRWVARARAFENSHHCQCQVLKKCRTTKTLKSKSDKTTSIFSKRTYPTRFFCWKQTKFFFFFFRAFFGHGKFDAVTRKAGTKVGQFEVGR